MQGLFTFFFLLTFASLCSCHKKILGAHSSKTTFNVIDYGAVGNGLADDSKAFLKAWSDACATREGIGTLKVPAGKTFMLKPVKFTGPCKSSSVHFELGGNIVAPKSRGAWGNDKSKWIMFSDVSRLVFNGGGQINGRGSVWWKSCNGHSCQRPTALYIHNCKHLQLSGTHHLNSARNHISLNKCDHATLSDLSIIAPRNSPNTDGIDISDSSYLTIQHSNIGTGDDCIAMDSGTSNINIIDVACGPGHGISIGSLGKNGAHAIVENVYVSHCNLKRATNGLRIKTWRGGSGYVKNVTFEQITITNTQNPIIIDQTYSDVKTVNPENKNQKSGIKIIGVKYRDVTGTSASKTAINLDCRSGGCTNIFMDAINITSISSGSKTAASCNNAHGKALSTSPKVPCLSQ
ncbi:hypothetical protein RIF29_24379 [Crotalaria pallida]|uniref:Polygalacturonase n=1 Tax=Crotalaria pallida TaxID=3830 RepID=A0AAN9EK93_CROPI